MLLGAVFKAVEQVQVPMFEMSDAKRDFVAKDLLRQADEIGVALKWPSRFPMNSVLPLRVTLAAGVPHDLVRALFGAYWSDDRDISDPEVVADVATKCGLDGAALVAGAREQKQALFDTTAAAVEAGVFGAPTCVVKPEGRTPSLYWGSDRVGLAALAARGRDDLL
jgi:2-hydroxychromene-2-carboxylate isomerase